MLTVARGGGNRAQDHAVSADGGDVTPQRSDRRVSPVGIVLRLIVLATIAAAAVDVGLAALAGRHAEHGITYGMGHALASAAVMALLVTLVAVLPLVRALRGASAAGEHREDVLRGQVERQEFESKLTRALDMADCEADVLTVAEQALRVVNPDVASELLLADAGTGRLERVAARRGSSQLSGCHVDLPRSCPAIRGGRTLTFTSSTELDACPRLWGRADEPVAATCIPVAVAGTTSGVLHSVTPAENALVPEHVTRLEVVGTRVGARVGLLRALEQSQLQASTDSLTGLLNRRTIESKARDLMLRGERFSVVMADLDRFKQLNDTHGHHAGDQALRVFADVLASSLRPHDLVGRFGGEEFLILLPGTFAPVAVAAVERVRESLVLALAEGTTPGFTASFGVADSTMQDDFDELLRLADGALFEAKRRGRDRAVLANPDVLADPAHPWF